MHFNTVEEVLAACELAGYQPRSHVTGLGEQTYWVHLPDCERGSCFWGDIQFLDWANEHWRLLEIEKIRHQAGWWEEGEPANYGVVFFWYAPCGMREDEWRALGRPMPEDAEGTVAVATGRTEGVATGRTEGVRQFSTAPARVGPRFPAAYRLIRRGDGNGNTLPMLQGLFTWTEGTERGAEWRDLETQDEPHVEDAIPFGPINY
jgi:hypothetical protein